MISNGQKGLANEALVDATDNVGEESSLGFFRNSRVRLIAQLLGYKAAYFAFIFFVLGMFPSLFNQKSYDANLHWPREGGRTLATSFATWDGAHYLLLSEEGYQLDSPSCAFYPLWPMLIKAASYLTFINHFWSGIVLANVLSIVGLVIFHHFVTLNHGPSTANFALLMVLAFPGALFFSFIYTESLFFLLIILFFGLLFKESFFLAAVVGIFLPLTKAIGIFCIFPLFCHLLIKNKHWTAYFACFGPALGYFGYFLFMHVATGNPFEGFQAQKY